MENGHWWGQAASLTQLNETFTSTWRTFNDRDVVDRGEVPHMDYDDEQPVRATYVRDDMRAEYASGLKKSYFQSR